MIKQNTTKQIEDLNSRWASLSVHNKFLSKNEHSFKFSADCQALKNEIFLLYDKYKVFNINSIPDFSEFISLNQVVQKFNEFTKDLDSISSTLWINLRTELRILDEFEKKWQSRLLKLSKGNRYVFVLTHLNNELKSMRTLAPVLKYCVGDLFKDEHWAELLQGKMKLSPGVRVENLTYHHFFYARSFFSDTDNAQYLKNLCLRAQGEATVRESLLTVITFTKTAKFHLCDHHTSLYNSKSFTEISKRIIPIVSEWDTLFEKLWENLQNLDTLNDSPFFKLLSDSSKIYQNKLHVLDTYFKKLQAILSKWMILEPIILHGALPQEKDRFLQVDTDLRLIMQNIESDPRIICLLDVSIFPDVEKIFDKCINELEHCQRALSIFLEVKRSRMPRFYFLGDPRYECLIKNRKAMSITKLNQFYFPLL